MTATETKQQDAPPLPTVYRTRITVKIETTGQKTVNAFYDIPAIQMDELLPPSARENGHAAQARRTPGAVEAFTNRLQARERLSKMIGDQFARTLVQYLETLEPTPAVAKGEAE